MKRVIGFFFLLVFLVIITDRNIKEMAIAFFSTVAMLFIWPQGVRDVLRGTSSRRR